jgi:hypothetical protein
MNDAGLSGQAHQLQQPVLQSTQWATGVRLDTRYRRRRMNPDRFIFIQGVDVCLAFFAFFLGDPQYPTSNASVSLYVHPSWLQNSIVVKIPGSNQNGPVTILGVHMD